MPVENNHGELARHRQTETSRFEAGGYTASSDRLNLQRSLSVCVIEQHCSQQEPQMSHVLGKKKTTKKKEKSENRLHSNILIHRFSIIEFSPRARNRFNQVVEAKRFEGVFLCRKVC